MVWLLRTIFQFLDNIVYSIIPSIYNLFIDIAETTIFSADIIDIFATRIYGLLGIFMLFKVSFSILTYIVSPKDFDDQTKGFSKIVTNILITLTLLVMTPWIFNQAMEVQRIILRDNVLGKLILGSDGGFSANIAMLNPGQVIAYETLRAFYYLDTDTYPECNVVFEVGGSGDRYQCRARAFNDNEAAFDSLQFGVSTRSTAIYLSHDLAVARDSSGNFAMTYTPFVSTVVGIFVAWILVIFCFDIAIRSVKLGFYRLIAPIPIISRIDPKSAKDGLFKKWLTDAVKTYLDLFIRLVAIYFSVFIIGTVTTRATLINSVTGVPTTPSPMVIVFIIIGALMFAKNLPKLLEQLGFKLDSGSFTMNPIKKLGEVPGVGRAAGMVAGAGVGLIGGQGVRGKLGAMFGGAGRGLMSGNPRETAQRQAGVNQRMRQARQAGSTWGGRMGARYREAFGLQSDAERQSYEYDEDIKEIENQLAPIEAVDSAMSSVVDHVTRRLQEGRGRAGEEYERRQMRADYLKQNIGQTDALLGTITERHAIEAANRANEYLYGAGRESYINEARGNTALDGSFNNRWNTYEANARTANRAIAATGSDFETEHTDIGNIIAPLQTQITTLRSQQAQLHDQLRVDEANRVNINRSS